MTSDRKTILLADDELTIRALVRATLEGPSYRIIEAYDGYDALRLAEEELPDLLVIDWSMPRICGIDVIGRMRANPAFRNLPVILLTARSSDEDFEQARKLGVNAYLVKPFSPLELMEEVESLLHGNMRAR